MKVFVTGATGYLGSGLIRALERTGHQVLGLSRSADASRLRPSPGVEWMTGDLRDPERYREAAGACDGMIHAASDAVPEREDADRQAIETMVATARASGRRRVLVYTSGVYSIGPTGDRAVDETAPADHPAESVAWRTPHERRVLEVAAGTLTTAVVRPGNLYGGHGGYFGDFFAASARGTAPAVVGDGSNRWPAVHRDDAADLYVRILELAWSFVFQQVPATERLFHAVDGSQDRVIDMARAASLAAGADGAVRCEPLADARARLGAKADAMAMNQVVATARSAPVLGWRPRWRGFVANAHEMFEEWTREGARVGAET
jgi:nucleoside-diphosphate-sugar epimerase